MTDPKPEPAQPEEEAATAHEPLLEPGERKIVELVRAGLLNREIAEKLGLTEGTVKVYLNAIYKKTGTRNRTDLAVRSGQWRFGDDRHEQ